MNPPHLFKPLAWTLVPLLGMTLLPIASALPVIPPGFEEVDDGMLKTYEQNAELRTALDKMREGDLPAARVLTSAFLEKNPKSAAAHEMSGLLAALSGQLDEALLSLEKAVELEPQRFTALTKIGDIHFARNEVALARARYLQALAINQKDRHAHQRLGLILEEEGNLPEAAAHYQQGLVGTSPDYVGIKVNLAQIYNRYRRFEDTVKLLNPVVDPQCQNAMAHLVLASAYTGLGQSEAALASFKHAEELEGPNERIHLGMGIAYRNAGEFEKSLEEFDHALAAKPGWSGALFQKAETLLAMDKVEEAMASFEAAAAVDEDRTFILNRLAKVCAEHDKVERAIALYTDLIEKKEANVGTYLDYATLLQATGNLEEAAQVLTSGLEAFADHPELQYRLGTHHALALDYDQAASALAKARSLSPADPRILKAISLVAMRQEKLDEAIAAANDLLALVPESDADRFYLGTLFEMQGKVTEAEAQYRKVLERSPDQVASLNNLALIRLKEGNLPQALDLATRAASHAPENPSVLSTLGWIQYKNADLPAAQASLEAAVAKGGKSASHRYQLAVVYKERGEAAKAREQLRTALDLDSTFPEKAEAEALLKSLDAE